jgi:hypothetical protein
MKLVDIIWDTSSDETNVDELRNELEEYLNGLRMTDHITRDEQSGILDDFDKWAEEASIGDTYFYNGREYTLEKDEPDPEELGLPTEKEVPKKLENEDFDTIVDWASDDEGYCIKSCDIE